MIGRSTNVLGNIINALTRNDGRPRHVPYRDSRLTRYLTQSLGGKHGLIFLGNLHDLADYDLSLSLLRFLTRASSLESSLVEDKFTKDAQVEEV